MGITISLCMIVKNEEFNLGNCLATAHDLMDEIIIVDTGSTDKTIEIASKYTDKIYHFEWINDFSAARNFSFSKATKEYIMWLDADDIINEENRQKILSLKETLDKDIDVVIMDYHYSFDDDGNPVVVQPRERLLKRIKGFKWKNVVHETIDFPSIPGKVKAINSDIFISHMHKQADVAMSCFERNLQILEDSIEKGTFGLNELSYYGITLHGLGRHEEAIEELTKYFEWARKTNTPPRIDAYLTAYDIYLKQGDFESAYQLLEENETYFIDKSEYHTTLGDLAMTTLEDYESACYYYERAIKSKGTDFGGKYPAVKMQEYYYFKPYFNLGTCYTKLGKFKEAYKAFEKAAEYKETENLKALIKKIKMLSENF